MTPTHQQINDVLTYLYAYGHIDTLEYNRLLSVSFTGSTPEPQPPTIQPLKPHIVKLLEQRRKNRR